MKGVVKQESPLPHQQCVEAAVAGLVVWARACRPSCAALAVRADPLGRQGLWMMTVSVTGDSMLGVADLE